MKFVGIMSPMEDRENVAALIKEHGVHLDAEPFTFEPQIAHTGENVDSTWSRSASPSRCDSFQKP